MIILGQRYHFTEIEKKILNSKFNSIYTIIYKDFSVEENILKLQSIIKRDKTIVLNTKAAFDPKLLEYLTKLEKRGITFLTIEEFVEKYLHRIIITGTSFQKDLYLELTKYTLIQKIQKRIIDYIGVILLFIPTILAMIYSFFKIRKESPGELFYSQERIGYKEYSFDCLKLRSMHLDSEKDGPQFASENDPRTFPWGNKIRYTKLDELPQIWNVFKGEMHLIGPRPERDIWVQEFKKSIPFYSDRHLVRPGITGLAQIKYHYGQGEIDAKKKLEYDLYYIKNWSLKLELQIIWDTILFIIKKF